MSNRIFFIYIALIELFSFFLKISSTISFVTAGGNNFIRIYKCCNAQRSLRDIRGW